MSRRLWSLAIAAPLVCLALAVPVRAAAGPLYDIHATWGPTNIAPGDTKVSTAEAQFAIQVQNVGDGIGAADLLITDKLPTGITVTDITWPDPSIPPSACTGIGTGEVKCTLSAALVPIKAAAAGPKKGGSVQFSPVPSGYLPRIFIDVSVPKNATGEKPNIATVYGGSASLPSGSPCAQNEVALLTLPPCAKDVDEVRFDSAPAPFGIVSDSFLADNFTAASPSGEAVRQASGRPFELRVNFDITAKSGVNDQSGGDGTRYIASNGTARTVEFTLPRGMIGNPEAVPKCSPAVFADVGALQNATACPSNTQVGYLNVFVNQGNAYYGAGGEQAIGLGGGWVLANRVALYNLEPPEGVVADLAFSAGGLVQGHIYPTPDPAQNYAIKSVVPHITSFVQIRGQETTLWGVPADPAHDKFRWYTEEQEDGDILGASWGSELIRPFLTNPMDCGFDNGGARVRIDSYQHPEQFSTVQEYPDPLNVTGCDDERFRFEPDIALQPTDRHAGAPTGLDVHLQEPQRDDTVEDASELYAPNGDIQAIATPPMKKAVVTFPEGMTLNPSAAQGLGSCSSAQIGLGTDSPVTCPDNSQYGTLTLHTPILPVDEQPTGFIYIAKQIDNAFHNLLSLYLVIQKPEKGILVKIPGRLDLDPETGQITTTFNELPQFPVSDMEMKLKGGVRAGLVSSSTCGTKTIAAAFYSWQDPSTPHTVKSSYEITEKPDGSPCVGNLGQRPFGPQMLAGTLNNTAEIFSPFLLRLTRTDDDQELSQLNLKMPEGLTGKLAGIGRCSEAGIAQAISRTAGGDGALEQSDPSCPASSEIGMTNVGAGVGVPLTYVPGKIYLAGPYNGSPLSVVAITPAVVGPFDLGVVTMRTALSVDSTTTEVSALTDPFPQIFQGIPVRIRDVHLMLDRKEFTLNPTSCAEKQIDAHVTGTGGDMGSTADDSAADLATRFQAADCASLAFKPRLSFRLFGGTKRGAHPSFRALYKPRPNHANAAAVSVALPRSEFLDQGHIKTVCTRVQFAAKACPAGSVYGYVRAKSPLFEEAFSGPVYLRSSSNPLPDLVAALKGPASLPVEVNVAGRVDSVNGGIRNSFDVVPDVPVTSFVLRMQGGKKGLLVNSTDLCAKTHRATAKLKAQNGRRITLRPVMRVSCGTSRKNENSQHRRLPPR